MVTVESRQFLSQGTRCGGRLYLPQQLDRPPVVVMGHGLGAQQDFRLPASAEHFVQRGLAYVRSLPHVDGARLAIWGSSFGGAHVIQVAAEDHDISAVVSQVLAARMPSAVLKEYDCDHFQSYYPPVFDTFVEEQASFLVEKLSC